MTATEELRARLVKVDRLCAAFMAHATEANGGLLPEAPVLAGMANVATPALWRDLAETADVRFPSDETIRQCVKRFKIQADEAGQDPFRGLPS